MKKYMTLILSFLILAACKNNTESTLKIGEDSDVFQDNNTVAKGKYQGNGYTFNYPKNWNVTDDEAIDDGVHYIAVEKEGLDSSGLVTVISFDYTMDLDDMIEMNIEELRNNSFINNLNVESIEDDQYNTITSRKATFDFSTMGLKHQGNIIAFSGENSSYVLLSQEALEDHAVNKQGFEIIENSFSID